MVFEPALFDDFDKPTFVFLLLDIGGCMDGDNIRILNKAVETMITYFKKATNQNRMSIHLSVITFDNHAKLHIPLQPVENVTWCNLSAGGGTNLADALVMVKTMIEDRCAVPSRAYRPVVLLVSGGYPNDGWEKSMNDFINTGRSSKCDRMSLLIGDSSATSGMEKFLQCSINSVCFASNADCSATFFECS